MRDSIEQEAMAFDGVPCKSAEELGLRPEVFAALLEVADGLASGKYTHTSMEELRLLERRGKDFFSMSHWVKIDPEMQVREVADAQRHGCGTCCCIGGWVESVLMERHGSSSPPVHTWNNCDEREDDRFDLLCNPQVWDEDTISDRIKTWDSIEPAQAAHQIRYYLRTGEVDWEKSLRPDQLEPRSCRRTDSR